MQQIYQTTFTYVSKKGGALYICVLGVYKFCIPECGSLKTRQLTTRIPLLVNFAKFSRKAASSEKKPPDVLYKIKKMFLKI